MCGKYCKSSGAQTCAGNTYLEGNRQVTHEWVVGRPHMREGYTSVEVSFSRKLRTMHEPCFFAESPSLEKLSIPSSHGPSCTKYILDGGRNSRCLRVVTCPYSKAIEKSAKCKVQSASLFVLPKVRPKGSDYSRVLFLLFWVHCCRTYKLPLIVRVCDRLFSSLLFSRTGADLVDRR